MEKEILAKFKDPLKENEIEFALLPLNKIKIIEHQRKPSQAHVKRLVRSMELLGFTTPVIVVKKEKEGKKGKEEKKEANQKEKEEYIVIDGQHRFLAAKEKGAEFLPAVIVPEKISYYLIELNAEKTLTIREKSYVALQIYRRILEESAEQSEDSEEVQDMIEGGIHLVTLGLAYEEESRFVGSAFESVVRRIDSAYPLPLKEAIEKRKERVKLLLEANKKIKEITTAIKEELGNLPPFLYQTIISYANPIERKRVISESFEEVMEKLLKNLDDLSKNPKKILEGNEN